MIKKKKTLYEILEVASNASYPEIQAAHKNLTQKIQSENSGLSHQDVAFKLNVINFAFHTLSVPMSRDAYDAQLSTSDVDEKSSGSSNALALNPNADALSLKAEALLLRADAAALRADALLLRSDATTLRTDVTLRPDAASLKVFDRPYKEREGRKSLLERITNLELPFKKILTYFGGFIAFWMVIQVVFVLLANRQAGSGAGVNVKAEEKLYIQQYFQETGVRVKSKAEADLLDAQNKIKQDARNAEESERRAALDEQRAEELKEKKYQQFVEESRRTGDRVTENLRRDEERARQEEERKQARLDEEKRRQEEAESRRIEREMERYRRNLSEHP